MMILLFFFLVFIFNFNGRLISTEITGIDISGSEKNQFQSFGKIKEIVKEPQSQLAKNLQENENLFEEIEKQELLMPSQSIARDSSLMDNVQMSSDLSATAETVVFPSADSVVELQNKVKNQFQSKKTNSTNQFYTSIENQEYIVHAKPKVQVQPIVEETTSAILNESKSVRESSQKEPEKSTPQHEDIPSFSEWTQKQLAEAEAEKKKTDQNETSERLSKMRGKFRNKNYASPDCGAKIVAANPESVSSSSVLSSLKDEYMLNYCTNRIWFVVELCEAIQAKQLDLANFELFSSSPKHFSISVSLRFPTRDWSNVGKFTALDSRDVQTFNLHPHLFGKFVKVELHSHYGREQFCPISWVGVYGTSEYEVLAKEDERHSLTDEEDPYEEDLFVGHGRDAPKNLFSSATDAVLSIVKKATAPFMKIDNNDTKSDNSEKSFNLICAPCVSPRYITVCNNCSQDFYDEVFHVLSCENFNLDKLIMNYFVKRTLINGETCTKFGLDFNSLKSGAPFPSNYLENPRREVNYLTVMLKNSIIAALCNVLAVFENKVVVNATVESRHTLRNLTEKSESCKENSSKSEISISINPSTPYGVEFSSPSSSAPTMTSIFMAVFKSSEQLSKKIEPTKTLSEDEVKMLPPSDPYSESSVNTIEEQSTDLFSSRPAKSISTSTMIATKGFEVQSSIQNEHKFSFFEGKHVVEKEPESNNDSEKKANDTDNDSALESILSDINAIERAAESPSSVIPTASNLPAESIFLRLANRIKNLEINMSLSSTYLEELSKRYRVQLELLSKTLNLTIQKMEEQSKSDEVNERKKEKEIFELRMQLANLTRDLSALLREKNSWRPKMSSISQHVFFISVEIILVWKVFSYWKRFTDHENSTEKPEGLKNIPKKSRRRNSLEGVRGHEIPRRKLRRPSDEALEIALSRNSRDIFKVDKKKRKRKKDSKCSINVIQLKRKKSDEIYPKIEIDRTKPASVQEEPQKADFIFNKKSEIANRFAPISSSKYASETNNEDNKILQSYSSPIFLKTALAARSSRLKLISERESNKEQPVAIKMEQEFAKKERKSSNGLKKYMKKFF